VYLEEEIIEIYEFIRSKVVDVFTEAETKIADYLA